MIWLRSWDGVLHLSICFGLALLALTFASTAKADTVDDYIHKRMAAEHIPGLSLVVMRNGKIVKAKGYGRASLELGVPATPQTVYELASTTKPFVATAILLLLEDRKLTLDNKISQFIENTPDTWKDITVRHLLSQSSGIPDYLSDMRHDFPNDTPAEKIAQAAMAVPLLFPPGTKWSYSNTGYILLGMIIQKVSGMSYDDFLTKRIFQPLGMSDTQHDTPDAVVPRRATGYLWYGNAFHNADYLKFMMTNYGDRGILSTALDLAKFDVALSSNHILNSASLKEMWTPSIKIDGNFTYDFGYGLGWFIKTIHGHRQISHPGGSPGTATILSYYPADGLTVVLLTNGGKAYVQGLDLGVASYYIPGLATARPIPISSVQLDACTGYYNAYGFQILKATRDGSSLFLDDSGGVNNDFLPVSESRFLAEAADRGFAVTQDAQGEVTGATLRLGPDEIAVPRIGPLARAVKSQPDPNPALTQQIRAILQAFAQGGKAVTDSPQIAPQARNDFAHGPTPELAGMQRLTYVDVQNVEGRGIERHGTTVNRVLYYKLLIAGKTRFVLVYLTADGLVTDEDVVDD